MKGLTRSSPALVAWLASLPGLMLASTVLPLGIGNLRATSSPDAVPFASGLPEVHELAPLRSEYVDSSLLGSAATTAGAPESSGARSGQGSAELTSSQVTYIRHLVNDAFHDAYPIAALPFTGVTTTSGATREPGEPSRCGAAGTVWFSYVARSDTSVVVSTYGSDYAATVAVYTGEQKTRLTEVGGCVTRLAPVRVQRGRRYFFQVSGGRSRGDRLVFHLVPSPGLGTIVMESRSRDGRAALWLSDNPSISGDGRHVTFVSADHNLQDDDSTADTRAIGAEACVHAPLSPRTDSLRPCSVVLYQRDDMTATIAAIAGGYGHRSSGDGSLVAFVVGRAGTPVTGSLPFVGDAPPETVRGWSRDAGQVSPIVVRPDGVESLGKASFPVVSQDGRYVAFESDAEDVTPGQPVTHEGVFVRDQLSGLITRVPTPNGDEPDAASRPTCLSADGRYLVVVTGSTNVDPVDGDGDLEIYRVDTRSWQWRKVSVNRQGADADAPSGVLEYTTGQCISDDGRFVAFASAASDLVPGDDNDAVDVFVRDLEANVTDRVSVASSGEQANAPRTAGYVTTPVGDVCANSVTLDSCSGFADMDFGVALSRDARYVAWGSRATNLGDQADPNEAADIFRHDRVTGQTILISHAPDGSAARGGDSYGPPTMSDDGNTIVFTSRATNLVDGSVGSYPQVYVWRSS